MTKSLSGYANCAARPAAAGLPNGFYDLPSRLLVRAFDALIAWQSRSADRTQLGRLDDHMLRDIGLSRADVEREASKPFWRS